MFLWQQGIRYLWMVQLFGNTFHFNNNFVNAKKKLVEQAQKALYSVYYKIRSLFIDKIICNQFYATHEYDLKWKFRKSFYFYYYFYFVRVSFTMSNSICMLYVVYWFNRTRVAQSSFLCLVLLLSLFSYPLDCLHLFDLWRFLMTYLESFTMSNSICMLYVVYCNVFARTYLLSWVRIFSRY
jgi:hypothetical protein